MEFGSFCAVNKDIWGSIQLSFNYLAKQCNKRVFERGESSLSSLKEVGLELYIGGTHYRETFWLNEEATLDFVDC